jgi:O-methyltransferase involved in polyketide biosynthesis
MIETMPQKLDKVAETLLATVYVRAMESQRPDALIKDDIAVAVVAQGKYDFSRIKQIYMDEDDKVGIILRNREFDRYVRDFLSRNPQATVVHIGCGLDARFERVAERNGQVEWYDLDLAEVIEARRTLIGDEKAHYHLLGCSMFDSGWLDIVSANSRGRSCLFLAEGVFMYFEEAQVRALVLRLQARFPDAELVFDAFSPFLVRANNLRMALTKMGARYHWGLKRGQDVERWGQGLCFLDEWSYFDRPEPRLDHIRWMRHIPLFARVLRVVHYRLGPASS